MIIKLIRNRQIRSVLELGTGLGVVTLLVARTCAEKGEGLITTVDNGSSFNKLRIHLKSILSKDENFAHLVPFLSDYNQYMEQLLITLNLRDNVSLVQSDISCSNGKLIGLPSELSNKTYDLIISDFGMTNLFYWL